jgi:hypothetical protein
LFHLLLANVLNDLTEAKQALLTEGDTSLTVSGLTAASASKVVQAATKAGWQIGIFDKEGNDYEEAELSDEIGSFRINIQKPSRTPNELLDTLYVVTHQGFSDFLENGHPARKWKLLHLVTAFSCQSRIFGNWDTPLTLNERPATKPPRLLVKESATTREVPEDVRQWLLDEGSTLAENEFLHQLWAAHAFVALSRCVANEVDQQGNKLIFKGPPKLSLEFIKDQKPTAGSVLLASFQPLHDAALWVYESTKDAEAKHILLATEIARSGRSDGEVLTYFNEHLSSAFECARIAYQMSISEITKDTLKSLGDLRKAITEETSKATDATRQTIAAISTAMTVGVGLIAARLAVGIQPTLIATVMLIVFSYTALVAHTGWGFIKIQRALRKEWQSKLYRFLSTDEYKKMVGDPAADSERAFALTALGGLFCLSLLVIGVVYFGFNLEPIKKEPGSPNSSIHTAPVTPIAPAAVAHPPAAVSESAQAVDAQPGNKPATPIEQSTKKTSANSSHQTSSPPGQKHPGSLPKHGQ